MTKTKSDSDLNGDTLRQTLVSWFQTQLPDADDVRVGGLDRIEFGHSAEMMTLTLDWKSGDGQQHLDLVLRLRPPFPGLLEPYDLPRQYAILRGLEGTAVKAPRALWLEETGDVLGRAFYVMESIDGEVFERELPPQIAADAELIRRMSETMAEQIAAIHLVDLDATGLRSVATGTDYLTRELDHWAGEMHRVQLGRLPALERLLTELRSSQPEQCPRITLVHGDPKPGNFAFVDGTVSAVFDWEMATVGDPLADVGWVELLYINPASFTSKPAALTADEFVRRYEELTGIEARNREWYRAFQGFKMAVIMLVGGMLFDAGHSDDLRLSEMVFAVPFLTAMALDELGIKEKLDDGPIYPRQERISDVKAAVS